MTDFEWWGVNLRYADYPYNTTRLNERAVELPIADHWLEGRDRVLEVGNVLSHYGVQVPRLIVDRWEQGDGVSNVDVFDVAGEFDEIVAISTVEHVRWDEEPRTPGGSVAAIEHLVGLLAPGGRMLVTVPTGWNAPLDDWLLAGDTGCSRARSMIRAGNGWVQSPEVVVRPYGVGQPWAESVWIGEWMNV